MLEGLAGCSKWLGRKTPALVPRVLQNLSHTFLVLQLWWEILSLCASTSPRAEDGEHRALSLTSLLRDSHASV